MLCYKSSQHNLFTENFLKLQQLLNNHSPSYIFCKKFFVERDKSILLYQNYFQTECIYKIYR